MLRFKHLITVVTRRNTSQNVTYRKALTERKFIDSKCWIPSGTPHQCSASFGHFSCNQPWILSAASFRKFQSTNAIAMEQHNVGFLKRMVKKLGWLDHSRTKLKRSGYYLYEAVADQIDYGKFFKVFGLEDTFLSWFLITELHVWMLLVKVMMYGEEGRFVRNNIVEAMWEDVTERSKKLGAANPSIIKMQLGELSDQFQAAILGYDEGLLTNDVVLVGAIWRRFFQRKCVNPGDLECLTRYIRRQVKMLDEMPREKVLLKPDIVWLELQPIAPIISR